jgi:hypothetical protein
MGVGTRLQLSELMGVTLFRNSSDLRLRDLIVHWIKTSVPDKRSACNG